MASEQYSQAVRGSAGRPLSVSPSTGSIETNEYGDGESTVSDTYPIQVDPDFIIEELLIFAIPDDKVVNLTLENGNTVNGIEPNAQTVVIDTLEIDSAEVTDPEGSQGETSITVIGDAGAA